MAHNIHIFGIRHHGPGSAKSLVKALQECRPDIVLIEGPPDANALVPFVGHDDMRPPVALLLYNPKKPSQASFYPFAEFSPEWQAMLYGIQNKVPVQFMDLPVGISILLKEEAEENPQIQLELSESTSPEDELLRLDPFLRIAKLAGYSDSERWWEALVERSEQGSQHAAVDIFQSILDLMRALRDDKMLSGRPESRETLLREAFMRQTIRAAQKDGHQSIAVVCGAWHTPALADVVAIKPAADASVLKGLKKIKTESTWIPWSFDRLRLASGYGAGVVSPAWYRLLFRHQKAATTEWMTQTARLLRDNQLDTSSAHVIEAVRLAETLAVLRHTQLPGIDELREAAVAVLCEGAEKQLELIEREMIVGKVLGEVPDAVPTVPLKADFEEKAKKYRLEKNTEKNQIELDLRKANDLLKSQFLHRICLLGIEWGAENTAQGRRQGRFHEDWEMKWLPDYEIRIIEAGAWGNTIEAATFALTQKKITETEKLPELAKLLGVVLKADLPALMPFLIKKLQNVSAVSTDVLLLADTALPLAEILRYGHARALNTSDIEQLLAQITPRVCVQLSGACMGVNEEIAQEIMLKIIGFNRALALLRGYPSQEGAEEMWAETLGEISMTQGCAPLLSGLSARMLFDKGLYSAENTGNLMRLRLSRAAEPMDGAGWLEGFLHGSGLLLIHHQKLWSILDEWVSELDFEIFRGLLPLLRRTFSKFPQPEREKMMDLSKKETLPEKEKNGEIAWAAARAQAVLPVLEMILAK